jgi:2-phosphosulfolactate phosphatase
MKETEQRTVEVVFSPKLYEHKLTKENFITVVVDILRATTSICAALDHGVKEIIPVSGVEEARNHKINGHVVACERDGAVLDFADIGNSASEFMRPELKGKSIVFSTTNGTKIINMSRDADKVVVGSFVNLTALARWLKQQDENVVIFCAAWKNLFNLEDTVFAGALSELLLKDKKYHTACDSVKGGIDLWQHAKNDLAGYLSKSSHRNRLKHLVSDEDFKYTTEVDSSEVIPVLEGDKLVSL